MYIEPNTTISFLKGIPWEEDYQHTAFFLTSTAQQQYFQSKIKYTVAQQSYTRVKRGVIRVQIKAENLYDCNYLMFNNISFGNKWFYAFIKSVEYVNNEVSEVTFSIDVMQTWHFDYTLEQCFVERETSSTDGYFEHLEPENLETGEDVISVGNYSFNMNDLRVCILMSKGDNDAGFAGACVNNIYTPLRVNAGIPATDVSSLNAVINGMIVDEGQEDRIVAIYEYPGFLGTGTTTSPAHSQQSIPINKSTIDGYTPRNKKLYNYPYNFLLISNNNGQTATIKWENFGVSAQNSGTVKFDIAGVYLTTPCVMCYPLVHRGMAQDYDSGITISNFPQCAWVGDAFKAWWAQNRASVVTSGISTVLGAAGSAGLTAMAGAASGNPIIAAGSIARAGQQLNNAGWSINNLLAKTVDLQNTPPQVHGQALNESLNAGLGRYMFSFYAMTIRAANARIIDDYFTRYGYACKRNKVPNRNVRPHWTYTKTVGCQIIGNTSADDAELISKIYDNGITFWRNPSEIGNYSLDNSP